MTDEDLVGIVARAASLDERLNSVAGTSVLETDDGAGDRVLQAWKKNSAGGDADKFRIRLHWDGLDLATARALYRQPAFAPGTPLPAWATLFREVIAASAAFATNVPSPEPTEPVPFQEILLPFVVVARERLLARGGSHHVRFSERANRNAEHALLRRLARLAGDTLLLEFSLFRDQESSPLERWLDSTRTPEPRRLYDLFVARHHANPEAFFKEYTVLARMLSIVTDQWVEAQSELRGRLGEDWPRISQMLGWTETPCMVETIQTGLSDSHRGGRQVCVLHFTGEAKVVYKPKDLGLDAAFARLLAWLSEHGAPLSLRPLRILDRGSHGWVEFLEHEPCGDAEAGRRYYRRAGMLLCVLYVLEGNDCHLENLIACGEQPMLIDFETVPHPFLPPGFSQASAEANNLAETMLWNSVLRTGLLPWWKWGLVSGAAYDPSGLGGGTGPQATHRPKWMDVNTDDMDLGEGPVPLQSRVNLPRLNGVPLRLDEHEADITAGFAEMHRFLREQRASLLADDGPLQDLAGRTVRFLHRNTMLYAQLQRRALNPDCLRNGLVHSIELDFLARAFIPAGPVSAVQGHPAPPFWPVVVAERIAMSEGDVPFFTANSSGRSLPLPDGKTIVNCFPQSSFERVAKCLQALDDADCERQTSLIRGSFYARRAGEVIAESPAGVAAEPCAFSADQLIAVARTIGQDLAAQAIRGRDGSATWIAPQQHLEGGHFQFQRLGFKLYDGATGVALFLAALGKITGETEAGELARGALEPLLHQLRQPDQRLVIARTNGLGAGDGLGGMLYAVTRAGIWLGDDAMVSTACEAAMVVAPEFATGQSRYDVLLGMAGGILGLLAVHEASGSSAALEQARRLGRQLLAERVTGAAGLRTWAARGTLLFTGFSHGAAGIAYALARLYRAGRDEEFLAAAAEAVAYERSVFDPATKTWLDLGATVRGEVGPPRTRWCHGAPGIALGRLATLDVLDNATVRADIETGLEKTLAAGLQEFDFLCCGNFGRAETLLTAARQLGRPDLEATVQTHAMNLTKRARQRGFFGLDALLPREVYAPGFFNGTSGIGYMLLRIAAPDRLPAVLRWE